MSGMGVFDGCYEASRAAALAGVPVSTVYDWARKRIVTPSLSYTRPKLWSYADLMTLRIVYWLRHPKPDPSGVRLAPAIKMVDGRMSDEPEDDPPPPLIPATTMAKVQQALSQLDAGDIDPWALNERGHFSPLLVDRSGEIRLSIDGGVRTLGGQGLLDLEEFDLLGPFDTGESWGPDLRRPKPHLRIVPGMVSGEPHLAKSRLTTQAVASLADRGFSLEKIAKLYPRENPEGLREAIDLERQLAA